MSSCVALGSLAKRDRIREIAELDMFELGDSARICRFSSEIAAHLSVPHA